MVRIYFTADTHFGHKNIIKYCKRPFRNLEHMNNTIINNWNKIVGPDDLVYFLGDFCFKNSQKGEKPEKDYRYWLSKLNGRIVFFKGNHDSKDSLNIKLVSGVISIFGEEIFMCHNPEDYNKDYRINLVGHVHEKWKIKRLGKNILVNVGVDQWNFKPVTFEEINKAISLPRR